MTTLQKALKEKAVLDIALGMVLDDFIKATAGLPGKHIIACLKNSYLKLAQRQFKAKAKKGGR